MCSCCLLLFEMVLLLAGNPLVLSVLTFGSQRALKELISIHLVSLQTNMVPYLFKKLEPKTTVLKDRKVMEEQRNKTKLYYNKTG